MHFIASTLAIAVALTTFVSAIPHGKHGPPPSMSTLCWTMMGSKSAKHHILTSYTTTQTPCISTVTSTTTTTTTLVPSTGTVTATSTTTVSTDSTSTVPAPATFLPVQTTLPEGTYSGDGGPDPVDKRTVEIDVDLENNNKKSGGVRGGPRYPSQVTCKKWAPSPSCTTITTTVTSTSTVSPSAIFSTTTTTVTATLITSSTTVYAACATNNFIDGVVGQSPGNGIANIIPLPDGGAYPAYESEVTTTAYDCCVFGLLGPDSGIIFAFNESDDSCIIGAVNGQCPSTGQAGNPAAAVLGTYTFITGNLPCGEITAAE